MVIDPQNDFVDPAGSLSVKNADGDMDRFASFVEAAMPKIDDISCTLDSHRLVDISHPLWWKDAKGNHPSPFTALLPENGKIVGYMGTTLLGEFTTTCPESYERSYNYLTALKTGGRYPHVIWPNHCLIGDGGHNVWKNVSEAFHKWERYFETQLATIGFVTKGSNPWTEHFSGVKAEVPDPKDPSTQINTGLVQTLEKADIIILAGEALSHCMANTVRDIADNFSDPKYVQKLWLLSDCTSNVTGFDALGDTFIRELTAKGMNVTDSKQMLRRI